MINKSISYKVFKINSLDLKQTDCAMTYDHMMKQYDEAVSIIKEISSLEMFQILINLDEKGIKNMNKHLFHNWNHSDVNVWDYRNAKKTLQHLLLTIKSK